MARLTFRQAAVPAVAVAEGMQAMLAEPAVQRDPRPRYCFAVAAKETGLR